MFSAQQFVSPSSFSPPPVPAHHMGDTCINIGMRHLLQVIKFENNHPSHPHPLGKIMNFGWVTPFVYSPVLSLHPKSISPAVCFVRLGLIFHNLWLILLSFPLFSSTQYPKKEEKKKNHRVTFWDYLLAVFLFTPAWDQFLSFQIICPHHQCRGRSILHL